MKRKQGLYLKDIEQAIEAILSFTDGMRFEDFKSDDKTFSAVIRKIEIIGEASKSISVDVTSANKHIPWSEMARMRDKLIHGYFGVDSEVVWKTIKNDLPEILPMITELSKSVKD